MQRQKGFSDMLPVVVVVSIISCLVTVSAAMVLDLSFWVALIGYSIGGSIALLGAALLVSVKSRPSGGSLDVTAPDPSMYGLQKR